MDIKEFQNSYFISKIVNEVFSANELRENL